MDSAEEKVKDERETGHLDNDYSSESENDDEDESFTQEPLTEEEIEELIAELLEVESKAAEAQEALEEESLVQVEADVRKEVAQSLSGEELERAVVEEMSVFKEEWELELDELEIESAHLLEQLDGAGTDLSSIYKWIERQVTSGCCTEAWKKRSHWAGTQMPLDATESVASAENYLEIHRPARRHHGKILEEGASGFLGKKISTCEQDVANESTDANCDSFTKMCSERSYLEDITFGSKHWASVYLASTPQQAAELGLKFPGVNEVEEIDDIDGTSNDPFVADAIANEKSLSLTEEQRRNFRKVKEEDANDDLKLHVRVKRRGRKMRQKEYVKDPDVAKDISCTLQDGPDILVCDEAHIIKNTMGDTTRALKQVKCQRRIALTGSPLQNNLMEYYCMVDFVREGFLGSSHEFRNRFQNPIENGQHTNSTSEDVKIMNQRSHILYEQLKGFVQRRDASVVKNDLPPKTVFVISVKLSLLQRKLYRWFLDVHGFTKDKASGEKILKRSFFAGYQALSQIWNHPGILQLMKENKDSGKFENVQSSPADDSSSDENVVSNVNSGEKLGNPHKKNDDALLYVDWWRDLLQENNYKEVDYSGKIVLLLDILKMCSDIGDKALAFSQSLLTLDLIEYYLSKLPRKNGKRWKKGKDWYRLDGRTESAGRQKLVERFNEPSNKRVKCTLISTRAGSLGINLPSANRVIIVDGSWNPTYDLQAIYRAWRYGQTKPVFAYRLLAHATMEEKIYKRQVTKEGLAARVVDKQQVHRTMSKEELLHLFDFGDDENADTIHESGQDQEVVAKRKTTGSVGNSSDELIQSLISRHHPSWISNYHEHKTLLQENEDDKLSKEEQDLAWEVYRRILNCDDTQQVSPGECTLDQSTISVDASSLKPQQKVVAKSVVDQKAVLSTTAEAPESDDGLARAKYRHQNRFVLRKCTNLSHLLTLRSQGTKTGCSTICGECAEEIRWKNLKRDGNTVK